MSTVIVIILIIIQLSVGNELIVETFDNLDFGFNSHSYEQLIAAGVVIAIVTVLLLISIIIFRLYIRCFHRNVHHVRHYLLPSTQQLQQLQRIDADAMIRRQQELLTSVDKIRRQSMPIQTV